MFCSNAVSAHLLQDVLAFLAADPIIADARVDFPEPEIEEMDLEEEEKSSKTGAPSALAMQGRTTIAYSETDRIEREERKRIQAEKRELREYVLALRAARDPETQFLEMATFDDSNRRIYLPGHEKSKDAELGAHDMARKAMGLGESSSRTNRAAKILCFEIAGEKLETVRKRCENLEYPLLEEFDFRRDPSPDLVMKLKPSTRHRPYQEKSLHKMFGNGRARSGIIVLPCGAGKTLVGVTAVASVRKSAIVFCTHGVAVHQWKREFLRWTDIKYDRIKLFTSQDKDPLDDKPCIVITSYPMMAMDPKNRSQKSRAAIAQIVDREWGLVVCDEVHVAPAEKFKKCMTLVKSRCKLGLTATLVREDDKVQSLFWMMGPKLYEANWLDLQRDGHIAHVKCVEVWCPLTPAFYREYLLSNHAMKKKLYCMNPVKFNVCEYLMRVHEAKHHKILVFSDELVALECLARRLKRKFLHGGYGMRILHHITLLGQPHPSVKKF